jgi:hypothetical protein
VIGIYADYVSAPVLTGVATGWIKVTAWNGIDFPTSGTFTQAGYTFTISGPSIVGFMEVNGVESGAIVANRLGSVNITGEWFVLGTTSGVSNQTFQVPNNGVSRYVAGVFIEKTAGQKDYEFYPNAGTATTTGTDAYRGKVCWADATGLVSLGNSGSATNGYTPAAGLQVVIGNIFFENVASSSLTANTIPNATLGTRYHFTTTGGGVINIDKCNMAWYLSISQAYSCNVSNSGFIDAISVSEVASPMTFTKVGVGNKPTTALLTSALTLFSCFAGGTFTDCVWNRVSQASSGAYTNTINDIAGFTFIRDTMRCSTIRGNATTGSALITRAVGCQWTNPILLQGRMVFNTCTNCKVTDIVYVDCISGNTVTTYASYVCVVAASSMNCTFEGLTLPVPNCQPYTALFLVDVAGCSQIKVRNIGTRVAPLNLGTTNATGLIYAISGSATASDIKVQRVYCSNTRTGIMTSDNSSTRVTEENVFGDYSDAVDVMVCLNMVRKGMGGTGALTAQTAVYGTHWLDNFISTTTGRIAILMNEPSPLTTAQVTLTGGANFTAAGGLYMPMVGQSATFEMPYYALGHTGFANSALVMAGGTATNYTYDFAIDKNDGNGWSQMTTNNYTATTLGTALNALTGIDASKGFKLRLKITTGTANTAAITSVYITTVSTPTAQDYQYPLDTNTVTFTGLPTGTDMVILSAGTNTILAQQEANPSTSFSFVYSGAQNVDVGFIKPGYVPLYIRGLSLSTSDATIPVSLTPDRNYT